MNEQNIINKYGDRMADTVADIILDNRLRDQHKILAIFANNVASLKTLAQFSSNVEFSAMCSELIQAHSDILDKLHQPKTTH